MFFAFWQRLTSFLIMDTVNIRLAIATAKYYEKKTGLLAQQLAQKIGQLHHSIELPPQHIVPTLLNFIIRYVDHVPEFMEAVESIADEADLNAYIDPVLTITQEFFVHPPTLLNGCKGLHAIMAQAYLAHRFIEEVNDRFISHCGSALLPMDMIRSNLIIHHLLGEPFSNQLDEATRLIVDHLEQQEDVFSSASFIRYFNASNDGDWSASLNRWPCLVDTLSLNISLNKNIPRVIFH